MPEAFSFGPLLVPTRVVGFVLCALFAVWLVRRTAVFLKVDAALAGRIAEHSLWVGVIFARVGYVLLNWSAFSDEPWSAFYFWQPGYSFIAGIAGAVAFACYRIYGQRRDLRNPVTASLCAGFTVPTLLFAGLLVTMNRFVDSSILVPGDAVPRFELADLSGDLVNFSELEGKGLIVNFWASWCGPCRREMPLLEDIYQEYREQGLVLIGISVGESREVARSYADAVGVSYPIWGDLIRTGPGDTGGMRLSDQFNVVGLPSTFFIDRNGTIRSSYIGELNRAILQERIPGLLQ